MEELQALIAAIIDAFANRGRSKPGQGAAANANPAAGTARGSMSGLGAARTREPASGALDVPTPGSGPVIRTIPARAPVLRPQQGLGMLLGTALGARAGVPGQPAPGALAPGAPPDPAPPSARPAASAPEVPVRRQPPAASSTEAGLVSGLFARPQSLVAAFIVAEILAKPVALRERDTAGPSRAL